jgi:hypothetical protein
MGISAFYENYQTLILTTLALFFHFPVNYAAVKILLPE